MPLTLVYYRDKRAQTYPCRSEIVHLVYLKAGIELAEAPQYFLHLVGGYCVKPAAEAVELHQLQALMLAHNVRRRVKSCVISPLIDYAYRADYLLHMRHAVLGEHRKAVPCYHLGKTVVNLRVYMVGSARENYTALSVFLQEFQRFLALAPHFVLKGFVLGVRQLQRVIDLGFGNIHLGKQLRELLKKALRHALAVEYRQERVKEFNILTQFGNGVFDNLAVCSHHGTVIVIIAAVCVPHFVWNRGIEDQLYTAVYQRLNMPVGKLRGVAHRLGGHGLYTLIIDIARGFRRESYAEAQPAEKLVPERVILIHSQHTRKSDNAAPCNVSGHTVAVKKKPIFILIEIGQLFLARNIPRAALAAVVAYVALSVREFCYGQQAVIAALSAARGGFLSLEALQHFSGGNCASLSVVALEGYQSAAVGSHKTRLIGAHDFPAAYKLKGAQYAVVHERSALNYYLFTHIRGIAQFYNLKQRVFHYRVAQSRGYIRNGRALFLRLLYA